MKLAKCICAKRKAYLADACGPNMLAACGRSAETLACQMRRAMRLLICSAYKPAGTTAVFIRRALPHCHQNGIEPLAAIYENK